MGWYRVGAGERRGDLVQHPVGELAELRSGPGAQSQLGEEGSRPRGVEPVGHR